MKWREEKGNGMKRKEPLAKIPAGATYGIMG